MKRLAIVDDNTDLIEMYCEFLEDYERLVDLKTKSTSWTVRIK